MALGCDPKKHFKVLSEGQTVTLEDGSIIYPFQVIEDPSPSQSMVLIFMPDATYLDSLFDKPSLDHFMPYSIDHLDQKQTQLKLIYHSIPLSVLINERDRDFMRSFGP